MKRILLFSIGSAALAAGAYWTGYNRSRDEVRSMIGHLQEISTPKGIQALERVEIGGAGQWVSIRGYDLSNPVLLFVHGGPGAAEMPLSYLYQSPWEEFLTVVQWDQRGSGKSFDPALAEAYRTTLTYDRMISDLEEMVAYLRRRLGKEKIIVLGHSWGSRLGFDLALRRPEWLHAYVGVGQVSDLAESERIGYAFALGAAEKGANVAALAELKAIAPYPDAQGRVTVDKMLVQRKWLTYFGKSWFGQSDYRFLARAPTYSPAYTNSDVSNLARGEELSLEVLWPGVGGLRGERYRIDCPVVFALGRHDLHVNYELAIELLSRVEAPAKVLRVFEHSGHSPFVEEPGRFLRMLVEDVLPLAAEPDAGKPR